MEAMHALVVSSRHCGTYCRERKPKPRRLPTPILTATKCASMLTLPIVKSLRKCRWQAIHDGLVPALLHVKQSYSPQVSGPL